MKTTQRGQPKAAPAFALHGTDKIKGLIRSPLTGEVIKRCACGRPEYFRGQCFKCVQDEKENQP